MSKLFRLLRFIPLVLADLWLMFVTYLPRRVGNLLRFRYYKNRLKYLGDGATIDVGVHIQNPQYVSIGENTWIDRNVIILAGPYSARGREIIERSNSNYHLSKGEVWIGKGCHIANNSIISGLAGVYIGDLTCLSSGCKVYSFSHHYRSAASPRKKVTFGSRTPNETQVLIAGPIVIQKNVALASDVFVLPGVTIGQDVFARIRTVINEDVEENLIVAGNPMKVIRKRFPTSER